MLGYTSVPAWQLHDFEDDVAGLRSSLNVQICLCPAEAKEQAMQHTCTAAVCDCHPCQELLEQKESRNIHPESLDILKHCEFMQNQNIGSRPQCVMDVLGLLDMALPQ